MSKFSKVKYFKFPIGKYALFGSAPLGVRGLKNCQDIDIIATEDLWNECKKKNWKLKISDSGSQYLQNENIEIYKDWKPGQWDIKQLIKEAEIIDDLPFIKLEKVLVWKKLRNKEKDLKDIKILEQFLRNLKN